jgi:hypothetical protein
MERESGLLARLLLIYPPARAAKWTDDELPDDVADGWRETLERLLSIPLAEDEDGDPRPRFLPLSSEARRLYVEWHDPHVAETVEVENDDLAAHFAKLKGLSIRVALVLSALRLIEHGSTTNIDADSMRRAITITDWLKGHARRAYALLAEADENRDVRVLIEWIERRGGATTVRELTHGPRRFRGNPESARSALDKLAEDGLGGWDRSGGKPGRPAERFALSWGGTGTETLSQDRATGGFGAGASGDTSKNAPPGDCLADDRRDDHIQGVAHNIAVAPEPGDGPPPDHALADAIGHELDNNGGLFPDPADGFDPAGWAR